MFQSILFIFQDTITEVLNFSSGAERGTLCQIKNVYGHRNVKKDVMNSFNVCTDLVRFTTESYIVLLATRMKWKSHNNYVTTDAPEEAATDFERKLYVRKIATDIVNCCWQLPSLNEVEEVLDAEEGKE